MLLTATSLLRAGLFFWVANVFLFFVLGAYIFTAIFEAPQDPPMEFLRKLFDSDFMPHGHCYFWRPEILWVHVVGDAITALAYFLIPFGLYYIVRKRSIIRFKSMFVLFALFIFACGTTHVLSIISVWNPVYRIEGVVKIFTGLVSLFTAFMLFRIIPVALQLPSPTKLRKVNEELEKQNMALAQIAYAASHDMKEPLRGITIHSQRFMQKYGLQLTEDGRDMIDHIHSEGKRMYNMVQSLMDYSNLQPGNFKLEPISLESILETAQLNLRLLIEEKRAVIRVSELPVVQGNERLLSLVFTNLLENSIKYAGDKRPEVMVIVRDVNTHYEVQLRDNSVGFKKEYQLIVQEMFKRLQTDKSVRGAGMGLTISKRIMDVHEGEMNIQSEEGKGVTVTLRFKK